MGIEIRSGQLIAPFGPGSIYTDKNGVPTMICGLDYWFAQTVVPDGQTQQGKKKWKRTAATSDNPQSVEKSLVDESRLSELLGVPNFRLPPVKWDEQASLVIPGHRFPTWYVNNQTGQLRLFNFDTMSLNQRGEKKIPWKPVRFISVCEHGHIGEFPWKQWCGCTCLGENNLIYNESGGADLSSIRVSCSQCKKSRTLEGATYLHRENGVIDKTGLSRQNIDCHGGRSWLGKNGTQPGCQEKLAAVLINQSNIYFGRTISSIFLPDLRADELTSAIQAAFQEKEAKLVTAKLLKSFGQQDGFLNLLKDILVEKFPNEMPSDDVITKAYDSRNSGKLSDVINPTIDDSPMLAYRRAEFTVLREQVTAEQCKDLRVIPGCAPAALQKWIGRVNLVERLRETKVFYGFDRLERKNNPLADMPHRAIDQLFLNRPEQGMEWLPAARNYGEGIYIELQEDAVNRWLEENRAWLEARFDNAFIGRLAAEMLLLPPKQDVNWQWAARYLLVHTLAHILINQLVFECGYSTAALKERLYVSSDTTAPMAGMLIYTASGDSEGSLGGLVRLGRPALFEPMVKRAISRASWCSADPVCSEDKGGTGSRLINKAACHACVLLPETACETINNGLDRSVVVGTPVNPAFGFLSALLQDYSAV